MITAHRIGYQLSRVENKTWHATDATTLQDLPGKFYTATGEEVDQAVKKAAQAFVMYRKIPGQQRAVFLRVIADEIEVLGDTLVQRVMQESALAAARVRGERGRTTGQLRMFADLLEEGSWVDAVIDTANPTRTPPKPDLRRMLHPIGPVVVFTASNFPLAYSTAGGDTASALAAGCPVIVKAHEAHPGTNALVADAVIKAAEKTGMPDGVFSTVYARGYEVGAMLVKHPLTKGVGFTGSHAGGRALFDLASDRESPIPVFAEMSSINPIYLLPQAVEQHPEELANAIASSVNTGAGQFCTCPGLLIALDSVHLAHLVEFLKSDFASYPPLTMLHAGIQKNYSERKSRVFEAEAVFTEFVSSDQENGEQKAGPAIASLAASDFLEDPRMQDEVFGPFTMLIRCRNMEEMKAVAKCIQGQLTSTLRGTDGDFAYAQDLIDILREKAGRLVFNGVPTGVEVCNAMVHGGPYPATTDSRFTAVGHAAIRRWARPVAYQNCPQALLPDELKDGNPLGILWTVDELSGKW